MADQIASNIPFDEAFAKTRLRHLADVSRKNQTKAQIIVGVLITAGLMIVGFVAAFLLNFQGL